MQAELAARKLFARGEKNACGRKLGKYRTVYRCANMCILSRSCLLRFDQACLPLLAPGVWPSTVLSRKSLDWQRYMYCMCLSSGVHCNGGRLKHIEARRLKSKLDGKVSRVQNEQGTQQSQSRARTSQSRARTCLWNADTVTGCGMEGNPICGRIRTKAVQCPESRNAQQLYNVLNGNVIYYQTDTYCRLSVPRAQFHLTICVCL